MLKTLLNSNRDKICKNPCVFCQLVITDPEGSKYSPSIYNDLFNEHLENFSHKKEVLLIGDFNVNYNSNSDNKEFKSIITGNGFRQIVKEPTRVTDTSYLIDLVFTNCPVNKTHTYVIISSLSDHNMIETMKKINHLKHSSRTIKCKNYVKYYHQKFRNDVSEIVWSLVYSSSDVSVAVSHFNSKLREIIDNHAPFVKKGVKGHKSKWLHAEIKS